MKWIAYGIATAAYIGLIGVLMIKVDLLWFLALFLWNWKWNKEDWGTA